MANNQKVEVRHHFGVVASFDLSFKKVSVFYTFHYALPFIGQFHILLM